MHAGSRVAKRPSSVRVHHFHTERCDTMIALLLLAREPMLIYCSQYRSLPDLRQLTMAKQPFLPGYQFHNQALQNVIKKTVE